MACFSVPQINKFLCHFSLQKVNTSDMYCKFHSFISQGILVTILTSSMVWLLLLVLYLPYQLLWSPCVTGEGDDSIIYRRLDKAGVILIIVLLFTDSLLLVGVRKEEE